MTDNYEEEIKSLLSKANNLINHINLLLISKPKYVFSEECSINLDKYFRLTKRIEDLKKEKKCNHDYGVKSIDDEIYYECKKCNHIL